MIPFTKLTEKQIQRYMFHGSGTLAQCYNELVDAYEQQQQRITELEAQGLTKREQFAMAAMQGILADPNYSNAGMDIIAKYAIEAADALLAELDKAGGE